MSFTFWSFLSPIDVINTHVRLMFFSAFFFSLNHYDNGTYLCHANNNYTPDYAQINAIVFDVPVVELDLVKAVDQDKIYLNWTLIEWNSPVTTYLLYVSI